MTLPRFWAEDGKVHSRFIQPMTEEEALFHLENVGWLALNDTIMPETYVSRWGDLVRAIREARGQALSRPVEEIAA